MVSYEEMRKIKHASIAVALLFLFWSMFADVEILSVATAHAQAPDLSSAVTFLYLMVNVALTFLNTMLWAVVWILDILMRPGLIFDFTNGQEGAFLTMLHNMWILCRDIVNIIFVFVLIAGAILTVVTANTERLKKNAPAFVLALILVNFSWFIPRVIYDVSNIATFTVYQIPSMWGNDTCFASAIVTNADGSTGTQQKPCEVVKKVKFFSETSNLRSGLQEGAGVWQCPVPSIVCYLYVPYNSAEALTMGPGSQILSGLVVNYAQMRNLANPSVTNVTGTEGVTAMIVLLIKLIVILFIHVALFFPLLGMVVGFAIRIPIIWITMVFMPFVALSFVIKGVLPGEFDPWQKIGKTFLISVFLPAMVAVPFAIGFVMIRAGLQSSSSAFPAFAGLDAEFVDAGIPLYAGMGSLWDIFWMLIALAIMWVGVFTVLKQQKIGGAVIDKIKGIGTGLGKTMAQIPLALPMPLLPGGKSPLKALNDVKIAQNFISRGDFDSAKKALFAKESPKPGSLKTEIGKQSDNVKNEIKMSFATKIIQAPQGAERATAIQNMIDEVHRRFPDFKTMHQDDILQDIAQSFPDIQANLEQAIRDQRNTPPPPSAPVPNL